MELKETLSNILKNGTTLKSSGTTGPQKEIFQSPEKLYHANHMALACQNITEKSKIYTVCKMEHAGGLLAQTLPAFSIGAEIEVEPFNAYRWLEKINNFTHSHLTPGHCKILEYTKGFWTKDFKGVHITCGSDKVGWNTIEHFVKRGATFTTNWGMTEVGPCAINTTFTSLEQIEDYKSRSLDGATLIGDHTYCSVDIKDGELYVKGDISVYGDEWFATGDNVAVNGNGEFYYYGRI